MQTVRRRKRPRGLAAQCTRVFATILPSSAWASTVAAFCPRAWGSGGREHTFNLPSGLRELAPAFSGWEPAGAPSCHHPSSAVTSATVPWALTRIRVILPPLPVSQFYHFPLLVTHCFFICFVFIDTFFFLSENTNTSWFLKVEIVCFISSSV